MNSSKIVLNTSASFSSLRIENPKKAGPLTKESESNLKLFLSNIPLVNQLFSIQNMVGEGTFSKVYKAKHNQSQIDFALKCVIPTIKPTRIIPELRYLRDMGGDSNIIEIKTCLFEAGYTIIVMPFFPHDRFSDYIKELSLDEIKEYMRNLLIALKKVHSFNVIHRDIKPNNFLYNRAERRFALVDFGLAQYEADVLKASKTINRVHSNLLNNSRKPQHKVKNHQIEQQIKNKDNCNNSNFTKIQTANSLFKSKDKMVCVRKRLLIENDDENIFPHKFKKLKHDHHSPIKASVFNTPTTPIAFTNQFQLQSTLINGKLMNMTNLQSTPTFVNNNPITNVQVSNVQVPNTITPLSFNAIPNLNFDSISKSIAPLTPDNSSFISNGGLINTQTIVDPFKTPTKQQRSTNNILSQLQNSPNSMIIPETPPKSSFCQDKKLASTTVNLTKFLNSPSSNCTLNKSTTNHTATTTATTITKSTHRSSNINSLSSSLSNVNLNCKCFGLDQICKICAKRNECMAPRAGTPGFRAPEVLLKHLCQTSAIDIWSVGVIFASLLTKKYPFFRNTDDMTSLAEIISIFGSERVNKAAQSIGKKITSSEKLVEPVNLKETLTKLRGDQMEIEDSAFDLLDKLLDPNPNTRINAADALNHPFLNPSKTVQIN